MDREKVIEGMEQFRADLKPFCGNHADWERFDAGLSILKEQEYGETFTIIDTKTGKEADLYNIALHEDWAKHLCYCDMDGWAIMDDGSLLLLDECGRYAYADRERFKVVWNA